MLRTWWSAVPGIDEACAEGDMCEVQADSENLGGEHQYFFV